MLTYFLWKEINSFELFDIFTTVLFSIFTIAFDLILIPIEAIAFVIYKVLNKEG